MIKEFKASEKTFKSYMWVILFIVIAIIVFYLFLGVFPVGFLFFAVFAAILAFWSKDRVLITLHSDYLEAKEAIAAKKKLIRYKNIDRVEKHRTGRLLTIYLKSTNKKQNIALNAIQKSERNEFVELLKSKISED